MAPATATVEKEEMDMVKRLYTPTTKAEKLEAYSMIAGIYDKIFHLQQSHVKLNEYFLSHVPAGPLRVMDAGCGTGYSAIHLEKIRGARAITMVGVDFSRPMLEKAGSTGLYKTLVEADLNEPFDLPGGPVDAVMSAGVFMDHHVGPSAFVNILAHLRAGGIAAITVREKSYEGGREEYKKWVERSDCEMLLDSKDEYFSEGPTLSVPVMAYYLILRKRG